MKKQKGLSVTDFTSDHTHHTHSIVMTVFGRYLHGERKGNINPKSSASVTLFVRNTETVTGRLNRFKAETLLAIYKIEKIQPLTT